MNVTLDLKRQDNSILEKESESKSITKIQPQLKI